MKLLLPKTATNLDKIGGPLFYLGGPIRGASDWQATAARMFERRVPNCVIVNPCRYSEDHPLTTSRLLGDDNAFQRQTDWERWLMEAAADWLPHSCLIFWLPCESKENPRPKEEGPYAQDTYGELGEWRGRLMGRRHLRIVIGAEPGFPGLSQIERNFQCALEGTFSISNSLEEVIDQAVKISEVD